MSVASPLLSRIFGSARKRTRKSSPSKRESVFRGARIEPLEMRQMMTVEPIFSVSPISDDGAYTNSIDSADSGEFTLFTEYGEINQSPQYCTLPGGDCSGPVSADPVEGRAQAALEHVNYGAHSGRQVVQMQAQIPLTGIGGYSVPSRVTVETVFKDASFNTVASSPVTHYTTTGLGAGDPILLTGDVDTSSLATDMYNFDMIVKYYYGTNPADHSTETLIGKQAVVKRDDNGLGAGWNVNDAERLDIQSNGALWVYPNGASQWFDKNDFDGSYQAAGGDLRFGTLVHDPFNNTYTYTANDQSEWIFNSSGFLTSQKDRVGNTTDYTYVSGKLTEVEQNSNTTNARVTTYTYTSGRLTSVADFDGTTTFLYDGSNRLWKVIEADPDGGAGPKLSPETKFEYGASGRLWKTTDARNNVTEVMYDFAGRVKEIIQPCSGHWKVKPQQTLGLVDRGAATQNGTAANPAALTGPQDMEVTNERNNTNKYKLDRFGNVLSMTDPYAATTLYQRNSDGQPEYITSPDPGTGAGEDPLETDFIYDGNGNLEQMISPDGSSQTWTYEYTFNQVTEYIDQDGDRTLYAINSTTGNLDKIQQVIGNQDGVGNTETDDLITSFTYTTGGDNKPIGQVKTIVDPLGRTTEYTYTARGLVESVTEAKGTADQRVTSFQYDTAENLEFQTDALGRVTEWDYDALNRNIKRISADPDGAVTILNSLVWQYDYNALGQVEKVIDPSGATTTYAYDVRNRLDTETSADPDGTTGPLPALVTSYDYDCVGNLTFVTLPGGRVIEYVYDKLNRLEKEILPNPDPAFPTLKPTTEYDYDPLGRLDWTKDTFGNQTDYTYDELSRLETVTEPSPGGIAPRPVWTTTYTAAGQVETETDPEGRTTTYGYDDAGRLRTILGDDPDGVGGPDIAALTTYVLGKSGNVDSMRVRVDSNTANDLVTSYTYDFLDRIDTQTSPNGEVTAYNFDAADNLKDLTHGGDKTSWKYDQIDRLIEETDPFNNITQTYYYNDDGRLAGEYDRNERQTDYFYDKLGRVTAEFWYMDGRSIEYFFDELGRLDRIDDLDASAPDYDFVYDRLDRVIETNWTSGANSYSQKNIYDVGRRNFFEIKVNGASDMVDEYYYDNLSRVQILNRNQSAASYYAEFTYNKAGQTDNIKRYASAGLAAETRYTYDQAGWLDKLEHFNPSVTKIDGWDYKFDPAARLESVIAHNSAESVTYGYDKSGQLKTADYTSLVDESYNYDGTGNRDSAGGVTSLYTVNRLTDDGTFMYTYDDEGNRLTKVRKSGAAADDKTVEYAWDQRNRLSSVTFKRNDGTITKSVTYTYDAFDRMTKRVLDPDGNLGSATLVTEEYFWDGDEIVHTRSLVAGESHYYMIDPNTGDVLFDQKGSTVYVTLTDHLGTVRDLVNSNGQIVNHLVYDAFGNRKSETNPQGGAVPFSPQMGFTGQWFDVATGLQYNHHRWFDPATGRWLSEDPIGFAAGDGNLYRYAGTQVTTYTDADGLQKTPTLFQQLGGEVKGPTGGQHVRQPGPGPNDFLRQQGALLDFERSITVGIPAAAACAGDMTIEGLRFIPGGNSGVEFGRLLNGQGSIEEFGNAIALDLLFVDEAQRLIQAGGARPTLGFADDAARGAAGGAGGLARSQLFDDIARMTGTAEEKAAALMAGVNKIPNTTCDKIPNVSGGWHVFVGRKPASGAPPRILAIHPQTGEVFNGSASLLTRSPATGVTFLNADPRAIASQYAGSPAASRLK